MSTVITITQSNKVFVVQYQGQTLYCLNQKALVHHLRHQVGLDKTAIASVVHMFEYETTVSFDLAHTSRKVS